MARKSNENNKIAENKPHQTFEQKLRKQIDEIFQTPERDTPEHRKLKKEILSIAIEKMSQSAAFRLKQIIDTRMRKANDPDRVKLERGKLTIYKQQGSKKWYFEARIDGEQATIRKTCGTSDLQEAIAFAKEQYYEYRILKKNGLELTSPPFKRVADLYLAKVKKDFEGGYLSGPMYKQYISTIKILTSFYKKVNINKVSDDTWPDFMSSLKHKQYGLGYYKQIRQILIRILKFAKTKKLYKPDIPILKLPRAEETKRRPHFTKDEWSSLERFMDDYVAQSRNSTIRQARRLIQLYCLIMINTGMRTNDALVIRWCDIEDKIINGTHYLQIYAKGKRKPRYLIATDITKRYLTELEVFYGTIKPTDLLFLSPRGNTYNPKVPLKTMLTQANMLRDLQGDERTPYSMRHSYATWRLEEGMGIHLLATHLGTSVKMIEKHYSHIRAVEFAKQFAKNFEIDSQNLKELGFAPIETDDEDDSEEVEI